MLVARFREVVGIFVCGKEGEEAARVQTIGFWNHYIYKRNLAVVFAFSLSLGVLACKLSWMAQDGQPKAPHWSPCFPGLDFQKQISTGLNFEDLGFNYIGL